MSVRLEDLRVSIDTEDVGNGVMLGDLRPASIADLLDVLGEEGGETFEVVEKDGSYGRASIVQSSDLLFVDMDHEIATSLEPGRYLIFPIPAEVEKP